MNGELAVAAIIIGGLGIFAWPLLIALIVMGIYVTINKRKQRK